MKKNFEFVDIEDFEKKNCGNIKLTGDDENE